jgi:PAS domain S-box-containing protein
MITNVIKANNGSTLAPCMGRILVVDDEVGLKNILVEALTSQNYCVAGVTSGLEALELLKQSDFDILLSDLTMPEMDGLTLLPAATKIDPNLVCIIMTGQGSIQTAVDAMKFGAFDYVLKPFRLQTMMPVLTRAMNTRHLRQENVQLKEAVAIHELSQTIAFTLNPDIVISQLADAALKQSEADEVSVLLPNAQGDELYVAAVRGKARQRLLGERVPFQKSIAGWVGNELMPVILNGEVKDERFVALKPRPEIQSSISIPMQVANKLIGILNLNLVNRPRKFTAGEMKALSILAGTAAAALESAALYVKVETAEQNYRSIFENALHGIFRTTPDGQRFLSVNPAMARIFGFSSTDEMLEITDIRAQLGVDNKSHSAALGAVKANGSLLNLQAQVKRMDGTKIWIQSDFHGEFDEEGKLRYLDGYVMDVTDRRKAIDALTASEAELRALFEAMSDVIMVFDREGTCLKIAPSNLAALYKPADEQIGKTLHEILPRDLAERFVRHIKLALDTETTQRLEYALSIGGEERWFEGSVSTMSKNRVVWVARDISERKRAEGDLRQLAEEIGRQRLRLANIVATVPGVVWEASVDSDKCTQSIKYVSEYVETMLGYTIEEWLSTKNFWLSIIHPEDREVVAGRARAAYERGDKGSMEFRWVRKDGEPVWNESNFVIVKDDDGRPIGMRGVSTDITERKRAQEALQESESRYRLLFKQNPQPMWVFDTETLQFLEVNDAAIQHYGYSNDEFLSMKISDIRPEEDIPNLIEDVNSRSFGDMAVWRHRRKDGSIIYVEITAHEIAFAERSGRMVLAYDVTERYILEDQLRQSQKMEAIGLLAGGIAHDFNNLLTAINGYSELTLRKLQPQDPLTANVEEIRKAGNRAASLTRQLLAFSRKQVLKPQVLNLNTLIGDLEKMLRRLIGENIDLKTSFAVDLGSIKADPGQIEQVLMNLVVNARDAMPNGGRLTIETKSIWLDDEYSRAHMDVKTGPYVLMSVCDDGVGMSKETTARIFEPFFSTKPTGKGTGLGLSTVYGIVKQSGGSVTVYSELSQGTCFRVYFPQVGGATQDYKRVEEAEDDLKGSETILLVEDEDMVRKLALEALTDYGYHVLEAPNGGSALLTCEKEAGIDLLITDMVMPQMSGRELSDRLNQVRPEMRVLYMSGYTDDAVIHQGLLDETANFIQKPFAPKDLARKVREVLDWQEN